jgi:hypothetical protein
MPIILFPNLNDPNLALHNITLLNLALPSPGVPNLVPVGITLPAVTFTKASLDLFKKKKTPSYIENYGILKQICLKCGYFCKKKNLFATIRIWKQNLPAKFFCPEYLPDR